jgi:hypothetical protein
MRLEDPRDSNKRYFRSSDRLITQNGAWYFTTREGEQGPYPSREAAEEALEFFTCEKNDLHSFQQSRELFARGLPLPLVREVNN